jgi:outer membrane protein TolC
MVSAMPKKACQGGPLLVRLSISFFFCLCLVPAAHAQRIAGKVPVGIQSRTAPLTSMSLADCIHIGLERQPALVAHRASLGAAVAQSVALDKMACVSLLNREMDYRKQQACVGITIAEAAVGTAEWETTYAVSRCYFTVAYARKQQALVESVIDRLERARRTAADLVKKGDPDNVVTQVDVDKLAVNIDLLQLRQIEASNGVDRATAALREAMGLHHDEALPLVLEDFPAVGESPDRKVVVHLALSRRGEVVQAQGAARLAELEVCAQNTGCLLPFKLTFAAAADIHAAPIPQGASNGTYRPAAVGPEMPTTMVGHKADRVVRAQEYSSRAAAVVEKTQGLIALEAIDAFSRWQTAAAQVRVLRESVPKSAKLAELLAVRFDNGKVSAEEYLRAQTLEDQTESQLNEAVYQHALSLAALERVTAGGFTLGYRRH